MSVSPIVGDIVHVYGRLPSLGVNGPTAAIVTETFEGEDGEVALINATMFPAVSSSDRVIRTVGLVYGGEEGIEGDFASWWSWPKRG